MRHDESSGFRGLLLGAAGMFATMYSTQAILPELSSDFGVSPSTAGLTVSVVVLAVAVGAWVWGPVSDRIGRPRAIQASSMLLVVPTVGVALAPTFPVLLVCRALQGACMPGLLVVGAPYVVEAFVPRIGTRAMGWWATALVAGGLVGRVGVALVTSLVGWRAAVGLLAVLPVTAALSMRGSLPLVGAPARSGNVVRSLASPALVGVALTGGALFFTFAGTFTYVPYRLEAPPFELGTAASSLVFVLWVVGAAGPLWGRLAGTLGWRRLTLASIGVVTAGLLTTLANVLPLIVLGLAAVAAAMFAGYTATQLGVSDVARADRGAASALYFTVYYSCGAIGAYVPGLAWEEHGWGGVVALGILGMAVASAGLALSGLDPRRRRRLRG